MSKIVYYVNGEPVLAEATDDDRKWGLRLKKHIAAMDHALDKGAKIASRKSAILGEMGLTRLRTKRGGKLRYVYHLRFTDFQIDGASYDDLRRWLCVACVASGMGYPFLELSLDRKSFKFYSMSGATFNGLV